MNTLLKNGTVIDYASNTNAKLDVEKIENKRVIVFDDIVTTGSTVNEISKILKLSF